MKSSKKNLINWQQIIKQPWNNLLLLWNQLNEEGVIYIFLIQINYNFLSNHNTRTDYLRPIKIMHFYYLDQYQILSRNSQKTIIKSLLYFINQINLSENLVHGNMLFLKVLIISIKNRSQNTEYSQLQIQEVDKDKKGNNSQKSPSQNSVHSLRSLHEQPDKVQQCSSPKSFGRSPVNQSSRNLRQGSMRSLKCSNSPVRGSVQLGVQFYSTNASKKYSLLHNTEQQKNPSTSFLQHNLTGVKVRLELLSKKDEESIKYIYWLKTYQLDHVNILKNLEVHQDNEWYQVVYDYFDGYKLSKLLGSEDLTENLLANIADQMFQTLMYLKEQKLTHGNITINSWEYVLKGGNIQFIECRNYNYY